MSPKSRIGTWKEWLTLDQKTIETCVPHDPGVYKIACARSLPRLVGWDQDGILVIGESKDLNNRINQFFRTITRPRTLIHSEGVTFHNLGMEDHFPISTLRFKFVIAEGKQEAEKLEALELKAYEDIHKEFPPLNVRPPNSRYYYQGTR